MKFFFLQAIEILQQGLVAGLQILFKAYAKFWFLFEIFCFKHLLFNLTLFWLDAQPRFFQKYICRLIPIFYFENLLYSIDFQHLKKDFGTIM